MPPKHEWQSFFDHHAPKYMDEPFTENTLAEVDFVVEELQLPPGGWVLDIGCGTGRHAVELAKRGLRVTGVDISEGMLSEARKAADAAGVALDLVHSDATQFTAARQYDGAICLCEGAFSLLGMNDDPIEHDLAILRNVHTALKPGARFILTAINGMRYARRYKDSDVAAGRFDPLTMTETFEMEFDTPEGRQALPVRERGYVPTELTLLLRLVGFRALHIGGGTAGDWGRRPLYLDEIEIMAIAEKPALPG